MLWLRPLVQHQWSHWKYANKKENISCDSDLGSIFNYFWLVLNWKQGWETEKLTVIDQLITIWDQLLKKLWLVPWEVVSHCSTNYIWDGHCLFITKFLRILHRCLSGQAVPGCRANFSTRQSRSYVKGQW